MIRVASLAIACLLAAGPAAADTLRLATAYTVAGTNPDGSRYGGTLALKVVSDTTFVVTWKVGSSTFRGFGMRWDDTLAVSYEGAGFKGVVMYRAGDDGVLDGRWTAAGSNGVGTERLEPR
jgi:hypothetical protein